MKNIFLAIFLLVNTHSAFAGNICYISTGIGVYSNNSWGDFCNILRLDIGTTPAVTNPYHRNYQQYTEALVYNGKGGNQKCKALYGDNYINDYETALSKMLKIIENTYLNKVCEVVKVLPR